MKIFLYRKCKNIAIFFRVCWFVVVFVLNTVSWKFALKVFCSHSVRSPPLGPKSSLLPKNFKTKNFPACRALEFSFFPYQHRRCCCFECVGVYLVIPRLFVRWLFHPPHKTFPKRFFPSMLYEILCCGRIGACLCAVLASCFLLFFPPAPTHAPEDVCWFSRVYLLPTGWMLSSQHPQNMPACRGKIRG